MLQKEMKLLICKKWRGRLLQGIVLLHNTCPHSVAHTKGTLQELKFEAPDHSTYSPYHALSDFNLFGLLMEALRSCQFADMMK
jgi:hypothetical protein